MTKPEDENSNKKPWVFWIALSCVVIAGYQVITGGGLKSLKLPGGIELHFFEPKNEVVELSRDYMIGRWRAKISFEGLNAETTTTYDADGNFYDDTTQFINGLGQQFKTSGTWVFDKKSDDEFVLYLSRYNGQDWTGRFRVVDSDKVQNVEQNYIAQRVN